MPMISSVQHSDNRVLNWGSQQWTNLNSSLQAGSKEQWSLVKTVGTLFLCVLGAWILSRIFRGSHTVTTNSSVSSHVDHRSTNTNVNDVSSRADRRSTSVTVNNGRIEFSNGPSSIPQITDAGQEKTQANRRIASSFKVIQLDIPGHFTVMQGTHATISLSADQNIFDRLQDIVSGQTLIIQAQPNTAFVTNRSIQYTIVVPKSVKEIKVSTAAQVTLSYLDSQEFRCTIENAGKVVVQGGQVRKQEITVSGAGSYDARSLSTNHTIVVINGAGNAHVKARESLDVNIPVTGTCICYGKEPESIKNNVSLIGKLIFQIDIAEA